MALNRTKEPSQRQLRVGEQIRHIIAETLRRGHFSHPALIDAGGLLSVTEVRISPDLRNATAYVIALGQQDMETLLDALNEDARIFQKDIARQANLKFTPRIFFKLDETYENASRIDSLLSEISQSRPLTDEHGEE